MALIGLEGEHVHRGVFVPKSARFQSWARLFDDESLLKNANFEMGIIDEIDSSPHAVRNLERRFGLIVSDAHAERVCFEEEFDCVG